MNESLSCHPVDYGLYLLISGAFVSWVSTRRVGGVGWNPLEWSSGKFV